MMFFNFGNLLPVPQSFQEESLMDHGERLTINMVILGNLMVRQPITYLELVEKLEISDYSVRRCCQHFGLELVCPSGSNFVTSEVSVSATNAGRAFDFLHKNCPDALKFLAEELGGTVEIMFEEIKDWLIVEQDDLTSWRKAF